MIPALHRLSTSRTPCGVYYMVCWAQCQLPLQMSLPAPMLKGHITDNTNDIIYLIVH